MVIKKSEPGSDFSQDSSSSDQSERRGAEVTESLDASIPNENIVSVFHYGCSGKWIAIQCNEDGSFYLGVGNTEPLARRIAALKGIRAVQDGNEKSNKLGISGESEKYLRWKDDLRGVLEKQRKIIDMLLLGLSGAQQDLAEQTNKIASDGDRVNAVIMMIQAIGVSVRSVCQLSTDTEMTLRDCFPIARSVVEGVVNVAFIMAEGTVAAQSAQRHALQKYYRDLDREAKIGNLSIRLSYGESVDPNSIPDLQAAIDEFTTKRGQEIQSWTPYSIDKRIQIIQSKYGEQIGAGLLAGRFSIYRHSSEIIHGTYFGARYFWQPAIVDDHARTKDAMVKYLFDHFFTIFNATYFSIDCLFSIFDTEYDMPSIRRAAKVLSEEFCELEFVKDALSQETRR